MDDLISRQALINALLAEDYKEHQYCYPCKEVLLTIKGLPPSQHWTPTASRLPDPGRYIVTVKRYGKKGNKTSVSNYNNGTWSGYDAEDVLAWMPLPAPMEGNE